MSDSSNSGIYVAEDPARGQPIPLDGESVTAFVGPAPRGPVDHAVRVDSSETFQKIFGIPEYHCRLEFAVRQFFANGGSNAVVVRISATRACNKIFLPGDAGDLVLEARNPGPLEYLRASVDYDGLDILPGETAETCKRFNLVVQRLRGPGSAWIDSQEYHRNISIDPASRDFVGYVLSQSDLVRFAGDLPLSRPHEVIRPTTMREAGYVEAVTDRVHSPIPGDYDLVGSAAQGTGLNALEHVADVGQLCILPGGDGESLGPVGLLAADRFCREHQALLIVDPPARWQSVDDVLADQETSGFSSPNAVTWYPGVRARNRQGTSIVTTVVGSVAASLNALDAPQGVHPFYSDGPIMLRGGVKLTAQLSAADIRRLARAGVNSLVRRSPLHFQLQGNVSQARYASMAHDWDNLRLRRQALFILRRIRLGTRWTLFLESSPALWREVGEQIDEFLLALFERSVLVGDSVEQACFMKCDADTNRGLAGNMGDIAFIVGFALREPGEFLAFRVHIASGECRISELGWQAGFAQAV